MTFSLAIIEGNLTRDPELRFTPQGTAVVSGSMAIKRRFPRKDANGNRLDETDFVDFQLWGKSAEAFEKHHKKGYLACIFGELRQDTWEDKNTGQKRSKLFVNGDRWEFRNQREAAAPASDPDDVWGGTAGEDPFA